MYFDYAATTPPADAVLATFDAVNRKFWANPQALYRPGVQAEQLLEQARRQVLDLLGAAQGYRCVFTSGATESNNMAIQCVAHQHKDRGRHIITSAIEHPSVLAVCLHLQDEGWELDILPVNAAGQVEPEVLSDALRPDTAVVSLMHVNNEVGSVNNIMELGRVIKERGNAVFHVDAAQSAGKFPLRLDGSMVDMLTFSAHKFFGLKGSGALVMKSRMETPPLLLGGGQEAGFRSGTADPARAAALAKALRLSLEGHDAVFGRVKAFKGKIAEALAGIGGVELNGALEGSSPFIINGSVPGVRPETLLQALAEREIYISTVSACSSQKQSESHVVRAVTGSMERAQTSIRISLSALTTGNEVDTLCAAIGDVVESLRVKRN